MEGPLYLLQATRNPLQNSGNNNFDFPAIIRSKIQMTELWFSNYTYGASTRFEISWICYFFVCQLIQTFGDRLKMTDFKQLHIERPIDDGQALTDDDIYWRPLSSSHPTTLREYGPVTTINISPTRQQWISTTDSTRVQVYSPDTLSLVRSFYSFKDTAYCGTFRSGFIYEKSLDFVYVCLYFKIQSN